MNIRHMAAMYHVIPHSQLLMWPWTPRGPCDCWGNCGDRGLSNHSVKPVAKTLRKSWKNTIQRINSRIMKRRWQRKSRKRWGKKKWKHVETWQNLWKQKLEGKILPETCEKLGKTRGYLPTKNHLPLLRIRSCSRHSVSVRKSAAFDVSHKSSLVLWVLSGFYLWVCLCLYFPPKKRETKL